MRTPTVSVCVPTRNQARYIGAAVAGALEQDLDDIEVLVHDDASSDDTAAVVKELGDPRVRYLRHPRPLGVARNRNSCLAVARGRYIAWLDSDDAYLPGMLERQVTVLESEPSVGLMHGAFEVIDEDGERLPPWPRPFQEDTVEPAIAAFGQLLVANEITTSTVVVRRSSHDLAGQFASDIGGSSSDWDMWLRIALLADVAYTATPVARYRQHAGTISRRTSQSGERLRCDVRVVRRTLGRRAPVPDRRRAAAKAHAALAARALLYAGDSFTRARRAESIRAVMLATRLAPRTIGVLAPRLLRATARGDDYTCYRTTKTMLARLAEELEGTRYATKLRRAADSDPAWDGVLARIAETMRQVIPPDAVVASVTKWDPTLLSLSRRRGRQFPDRRTTADGYPREGTTVIDHLEALRSEGVSHIVFPSASFWWLEHYADFALHLEGRYSTLWRDDDCLIYDLGGGDGRAAKVR